MENWRPHGNISQEQVGKIFKRTLKPRAGPNAPRVQPPAVIPNLVNAGKQVTYRDLLPIFENIEKKHGSTLQKKRKTRRNRKASRKNRRH